MMASKGRSTHNDNLPVHDILSLKEKIRDLKTLQENLNKEKDQILSDIANKEKLFVKYRQELTLLEPTKDLRWQATDLANEDSFSRADIAKYNLMNEKIEMQILIAELHHSLPGLEQKMKIHEERAKYNSKSAPKSMKTLIQQANAQLQNKKLSDQEQKFDCILWKSASELEDLISQRIEDMVKMKKQQNQQNDAAQQENQVVIDDIINARHRVELMFKEKALLRKEQVQVMTKNIHKYKYDYLGEEIRALRLDLRKYDNGLAWQEKLFTHYLASNTKKKGLSTRSKCSHYDFPVLQYLSDGLIGVYLDEEESNNATLMMKLTEIGPCLRYAIFPKKSTSLEESQHPYWAEERFLRSLLEEILYEDLLSKERTALTVEQLMKSNQDTPIISEKKKPITIDEGEEDDFDAEVDELLVIPSTAAATSSTAGKQPTVTIPAYREKELQAEAKEKCHRLDAIDMHTFCLLCNRIIVEVE